MVNKPTVNIPRSRPPGRNGVSLTQRAIEIDLGRGGPSDSAPIGPANPMNLTVSDPAALSSFSRTNHISVGPALQVGAGGTGKVVITLAGIYTYEHFAFTSMNIAGSNETERVRRGIDLNLWTHGRITCCASSDGDGFALSAEYYDTIVPGWLPLGPTLAFPDSISVDTDAGYQEGSWADLDADATGQGWSQIRVFCSGDSASDDIYAIDLVLRRPNSA